LGRGETLSDRFYTPTLSRPDNERQEKAHVFQIEYGAGRRMALRHQRESIRHHCSIHDHCCVHGFILRMKWIKLQSPSRELTLWGAYAGRFQYTLSYHSGAMKWACLTKLSGSAEPSTPLGEFDHRHEAVAACEQHHRATEKHSARITSGRDGSCLTKLALTVPLHWRARWRNSPGTVPCWSRLL
jgi:hypothetical protein